MRKFRIRKALGRLSLIGAAVGVAALAHGNGQAEPEPRPSPEQVQRFLDRLEARQIEEADREKGYEKRLLNVVEGAATRSPPVAMINRIEKSVVSRLG